MDPELEALIEAEALRLLLPRTSGEGGSVSAATRPIELLVECGAPQGTGALAYVARWRPPLPSKLDAAYRRCLEDRAALKAKTDERERLEREAEDRECTFKPKISEASSTMVRSAGADTNFYDAGQEWLKRRAKKLDVKKARRDAEAAELSAAEVKPLPISQRSLELAARVDRTPLSPGREESSERMRKGRPAVRVGDGVRRHSFSPVLSERTLQLAHVVQQGESFLHRMLEDAQDREVRRNAWLSPAKNIKLSAWELQDAVERLYSPPQRVYEHRRTVPPPPDAEPTFTPKTSDYKRPPGAAAPLSDHALRRKLFDPVELYVARPTVLPRHEIDAFVARTHEWHRLAQLRRADLLKVKEEAEQAPCTFHPQTSRYDLSMQHWESTMTIAQQKKSTEAQRAALNTPRSTRREHPPVQPYTPDGWQTMRRARSSHAAALLTPRTRSDESAVQPGAGADGASSGGGGLPLAAADASHEHMEDLKAWFAELERGSSCGGWVPRAVAVRALCSLAEECGVIAHRSTAAELENELGARVPFVDFVYLFNRIFGGEEARRGC